MNSRAKGKRGELELVHILKGYGFEVRRGQQYSGANGDADIEGLAGYHVEVKRRERLDIEAALVQSEHDAREGETPIVAHRRNGEAWKVTLRLADFIELIRGTE